jgi:hypothetical protein
MCASAECHLDLLLVKKIHGRQVDTQSGETHGIPAIVNEGDNFSFALFEQALHQRRANKTGCP